MGVVGGLIGVHFVIGEGGKEVIGAKVRLG